MDRKERRAKTLVSVALFLTTVNNSCVMAIVSPVIPRLILDIKNHPDRTFANHFIDKLPGLSSSTNSSGEILEQKYGFEIALLTVVKQSSAFACNLLCGLFLVKSGSGGYRPVVITGTVLSILASIAFAYLRNYELLVLSRVPQGLADAMMLVGGLALLTATITDLDEQAVSMSRVVSGFAVGEGVGYAVGSSLVEYAGIQTPFLLVVAWNLVILCIYCVTPKPTTKITHQPNMKEALNLLKDMKILAGLVMVAVQYFDFGMFVGTVPTWMTYELKAKGWELGLVLALGMVAQVFPEFYSAHISLKIGHWRCVLFGFMLMTLGIALYPLCKSVWAVLIPLSIERIGFGLAEGSLAPVLNQLTAKKDPLLSGAVNGLFTAGFNLGVTAGSLASGALLKTFSFKEIYWGFVMVYLAFCPVALLWRKVDLSDSKRYEAPSEETKLLMD